MLRGGYGVVSLGGASAERFANETKKQKGGAVVAHACDHEMQTRGSEVQVRLNLTNLGYMRLSGGGKEGEGQ